MKAASENMRTLSGDLVADDLEADTPAGDAARRLAHQRIQDAKSAEFHALDLVLDVGVAGSPVVADGAGDRLPHAWLPDGRSLYDVLGAGFTLLTPPGFASAGLVDACARRGVPLAVTPLSDGDEALLVRPDQHVAWRGAHRPTTRWRWWSASRAESWAGSGLGGRHHQDGPVGVVEHGHGRAAQHQLAQRRASP